MPRREFLQLAHTYDPEKHDVSGWYSSEKLDGTRCFWDGGVTRGVATADVPWAGLIDPKTGDVKKKIKPVATGLWSRYGNPIMAPNGFLNQLPACPLDGELWAGRGNFQLCRSICGGDEPDPRFERIRFAAYGSPPIDQLFLEGEIKNSSMRLFVDPLVMNEWFNDAICEFGSDYRMLVGGVSFDDELAFLRDVLSDGSDVVYLHRQVKLPNDRHAALQQAYEFLQTVLDLGGEGAVLRDPHAPWTPRRHRGLLKYKPFSDAEAEIVGFVTGNTGKQGTVHGKIGALVVRHSNVTFEIGTGLTLEEREFSCRGDTRWALDNPGRRTEAGIQGRHFRIGDTITFKYRELSDDGVPKEARYWRRRCAV